MARASWLLERIAATGTLVMRKLGGGRAGELRSTGCCRSRRSLAGGARCRRGAHADPVRGRRSIVAQDTTEISFAGHPIGGGDLRRPATGDRRYFIHPQIAVDADDEAVVGGGRDVAERRRPAEGPGRGDRTHRQRNVASLLEQPRGVLSSAASAYAGSRCIQGSRFWDGMACSSKKPTTPALDAAGGRCLFWQPEWGRLKVDDRSRRTVSTDFLTVRELAALLRVKPRKVYGLAASSEIPCSRATGKLLFPRDGIEAWLARHGAAPSVSSDHPKRPPIIVGSHDPLLDWALRESGSGIASFLDGSLDGLDRLRRGEAIAAGIHLIETGPDGWNRRHVQDAIGDQPIVLLEWAWRDRGLLVGAGNPLDIDGIQALRGHRFIPRQPGAGSQVLLEASPGTRAVHGRARLSGAHCPQRGRGCGERARRQGGRGLRSRVSRPAVSP